MQRARGLKAMCNMESESESD